MNKFYTIKVQWSLEKTTTLYKNNIAQFILQLQIKIVNKRLQDMKID